MFIGNIIAYTGNDIPSGYLVCDGSAVGRDEYSELFDVIGTTYGDGDGVLTFNIPNLLGKAGLGSSQNHVVGSSGGEESHILLPSEIPQHSHIIPSHTHAASISATAELEHTITQPNMQYSRLDTFKTCAYPTSGNAGYISRTNRTMTIATNLAIANHPATACTVTGGIIDCPEFETENAGEGIGHNNMMPYLAVTYIIKAGNPVPPEPGMVLYNGCLVVSAGGGYITGRA